MVRPSPTSSDFWLWDCTNSQATWAPALVLVIGCRIGWGSRTGAAPPRRTRESWLASIDTRTATAPAATRTAANRVALIAEGTPGVSIRFPFDTGATRMRARRASALKRGADLCGRRGQHLELGEGLVPRQVLHPAVGREEEAL